VGEDGDVGEAEGAGVGLLVGAGEDALGAGVPLGELAGTEVLLGVAVFGGVELCAKAGARGMKMSEAIRKNAARRRV
jgi:hypothetical protein